MVSASAGLGLDLPLRFCHPDAERSDAEGSMYFFDWQGLHGHSGSGLYLEIISGTIECVHDLCSANPKARFT